VSTHSRT